MADDFDNVTEECFTSTKSYYNFPCAHRQYRHEGNCHLITWVTAVTIRT